MEPDARSRPVFAFHRPETLAEWLMDESKKPGSTLRARLRHILPLGGTATPGCAPGDTATPGGVTADTGRSACVTVGGLWPAQIKAIRNLEDSLAHGRPRALIQMASGGGKTFTACNFCYRLIKHAGAQRILFLVDRNNLGRQAKGEFEQFSTPEEHRKFTELYNVQHLKSNKLDPVSKVCITTIQRLFAMLKGEEEVDPEIEEQLLGNLESVIKKPIPVSYNPAIPIDFFDFIVVDECHRSIYNLWRQVLEYFDSFLIGLTATPSQQTLGFFNQNLVSEYNHEQAVADQVNVGFDVYRIRTVVSEYGSTVIAGLWVDKRDRQSRKVRWEQLDRDFSYASRQLDQDVVAPDQIRTIVRTFKDRLFTEIFPGRTEVPKTLIFAKDDSHAEDIVNIVREEFGKGNDFCQKITYRTGTVRVLAQKKLADGTEVEEFVYKNMGAVTAEELLTSFRNSYFPRVAVTVDMIATGTDVRPLECVMFLREVKSRNLFEQMKGRGARVVTTTDLQAVTPDAEAKTHFIIVDAVGACETDLVDTHPLEKKPSVSFEKLLDAVAFGNRERDVLSSLASRLARLDRQLNKEGQKMIAESAGGQSLSAITRSLVDALDPDAGSTATPGCEGVSDTATPGCVPESTGRSACATLLAEAAKPLATNPALRNKLIELKRSYEQTIDTVTKDEVLEAGFSAAAKEKARSVVESFEKFIQEHKDEITALQILYSRPYSQRLTLKGIKDLASAIEKPPRGWTPQVLWRAYETLEKSKVRGAGGKVMADSVSLVRFALHQDNELRPFHDQVNERFAQWLMQQEEKGRKFTGEQRQWLEAIRDHIANSLAIQVDDFDYVPFAQRGGLGKANQVFGKDLGPLLNEMNEVLAA